MSEIHKEITNNIKRTLTLLKNKECIENDIKDEFAKQLENLHAMFAEFTEGVTELAQMYIKDVGILTEENKQLKEKNMWHKFSEEKPVKYATVEVSNITGSKFHIGEYDGEDFWGTDGSGVSFDVSYWRYPILDISTEEKIPTVQEIHTEELAGKDQKIAELRKENVEQRCWKSQTEKPEEGALLVVMGNDTWDIKKTMTATYRDGEYLDKDGNSIPFTVSYWYSIEDLYIPDTD